MMSASTNRLKSKNVIEEMIDVEHLLSDKIEMASTVYLQLRGQQNDSEKDEFTKEIA